MNREVHVRLREGLRGKFPRSTRLINAGYLTSYASEEIMKKVRNPQNQPSPGVSNETIAERYRTCREDIAELAIVDIQSCPIILDFKEPNVIAFSTKLKILLV